jgi:hypothetical protein
MLGRLMKIALGLFVDAVYDLQSNWRVAVRIAFVPFVLMTAIATWQSYELWFGVQSGFVSIAYLVATMVLLNIVSINWFRFMILKEHPRKPPHNWQARLLWPYIFQEFVYAAVSFVPAAIVVFVLVGASTGFNAAESAMTTLMEFVDDPHLSWGAFCIMLAAGWVYYFVYLRIGVGLVSIATEQTAHEDMSGWRRTKRLIGPVVFIAFLFALLQSCILFFFQYDTIFLSIPNSAIRLYFVLGVLSEIISDLGSLLLSAVLARFYLSTRRKNITDVFA